MTATEVLISEAGPPACCRRWPTPRGLPGESLYGMTPEAGLPKGAP